MLSKVHQKLCTSVLRTTISGVVRAGVVAPLVAAPRRSYHPNVIEHYEKPQNVGSLDKNDPSVGTGT